MVVERVTAHGAFAFCDLAGFTAFTAERGDDAALELVTAFGSHVVDRLPADARIVNRVGDGLLLHFEEPAGAVSTLLALTDRCAEVATPASPLWVRTGVHVGEARRLGDDLIGHDINVAARIGELAGAGEVIASESARSADPAVDVCFEALGPAFVKGIRDPLALYRASRASRAQAG